VGEERYRYDPAHYLLTTVAKIVYHFCADKTGAADDHNFHFRIHMFLIRL